MNTLRILKTLAFILLIVLFALIVSMVKDAKSATITRTFTAQWTPFNQTQIDQYKFVNIELFDKDNKSLGKSTNALATSIQFNYTFEENDIQCFYLKANMQDGNATGNSNIFGFYIYKGKLIEIPFPDGNKTLKVQLN